MNVTFLPNGNVRMDNAKIVFRNFSGMPGKFNRDGDRNFAVVIDDEEIKDALINDENEYDMGWNVKIKPPRDDDDTPFMFLTVKLKFNDRGPHVYLKSGDNMVKLDEDSVGCLDNIDILSADLDIRPYDSSVNGKPFRAAYLQSMRVVQNVTDRFAEEYDSRA